MSVEIEDPAPEADNITKFPGNSRPVETVAHLDASVIADLRARRIIRENMINTVLDPVAPGEVACGNLTEEERILFSEMSSLQDEIEDMGKELTARSYEMVAQAVRKSDKPTNIPQHLDDSVMFPTDEDANDFFRMQTRYEYVSALYRSSIRERYGHGWAYGVRSGFTVVRKESRYKIPDAIKNSKL